MELKIRLFKLAADQGHAEAQYYLADAYVTGTNVAKNEQVALTWYRKAAERGYARAQYSLGMLYSKGRVVKRDDVQAYAWLELATTTFDDEDRADRDTALRERNAIAVRMTPAQLQQARKIVTDFKPTTR